MSYNEKSAKGFKQKQAYSRVVGDEEDLGNPLVTADFKRKVKVIETKLSTIQNKIKNLDDMHRQIGTVSDNRQLRNKIKTSLQETQNLIKVCSEDIKEFSGMEVPPDQMSNKRD